MTGDGLSWAFLWEKGVMYNLKDLTVNPSDPQFNPSGARAINDQGWIAVTSSARAFQMIPDCSLAPIYQLLLLD